MVELFILFRFGSVLPLACYKNDNGDWFEFISNDPMWIPEDESLYHLCKEQDLSELKDGQEICNLNGELWVMDVKDTHFTVQRRVSLEAVEFDLAVQEKDSWTDVPAELASVPSRLGLDRVPLGVEFKLDHVYLGTCTVVTERVEETELDELLNARKKAALVFKIIKSDKGTGTPELTLEQFETFANACVAVEEKETEK